MEPGIRPPPLDVTLLGASGRFTPENGFGHAVRALLDRAWPVIKAKSIPNPGINWVVYGHDGEVFAGVETQIPDPAAIGLERMDLRLKRYAEWTHVGPYSKLGQTYDAMHDALTAMGHRPTRPLVEIYGHWTDDESRLETRILWSIA